jgi:hypothetical protein
MRLKLLKRSLDQNRIGDEGARGLALALLRNATLTKLTYGSRWISYAGLQPTLTALDSV